MVVGLAGITIPIPPIPTTMSPITIDRATGPTDTTATTARTTEVGGAEGTKEASGDA